MKQIKLKKTEVFGRVPPRFGMDNHDASRGPIRAGALLIVVICSFVLFGGILLLMLRSIDEKFLDMELWRMLIFVIIGLFPVLLLVLYFMCTYQREDSPLYIGLLFDTVIVTYTVSVAIWIAVISAHGQTFMQWHNDMFYSIIPAIVIGLLSLALSGTRIGLKPLKTTVTSEDNQEKLPLGLFFLSVFAMCRNITINTYIDPFQ
jgi:hypothetical protein